MEPLHPDEPDLDLSSDSELDALLQEVARASGPRALPLPNLPSTLDLPPEALAKLVRSQLPSVGDLLDGRFRIERVLGRGGMGVVFESTNLRTQARVALKWMLPFGDDRDAEMAMRFRREACAAACIRHPNVVEVYDVAGPDSALFLVMELLRGESLLARIDDGPLSLADAKHMMCGVLAGVAAAHKAGIVHRDLKPDNVFLCRAEPGGRETAKILDFGVAALRREVETSPGLTRSGAIVGTPMYMAPEQFRGAEVDKRTDIYALGVVFYEALTGHLPFPANTGPAIAILQATTNPTPLWAYRPDLPKAAHELVGRALKHSPADRYQSAEEFLAALEALSDDPAPQPASSRPLAVLLLFVALNVLAVAYFALRYRDAPSAPGTGAAEHSRELRSAPPKHTPVERPVPATPTTVEAQSQGREEVSVPRVEAASAAPQGRTVPPATKAPKEAKAKHRSATSLQLQDFTQ